MAPNLPASVLAIASVIGACTFDPRKLAAQIDAPPDDAVVLGCFGQGGFEICVPANVTVPGSFAVDTSTTIDTANVEDCTFQLTQPRACVKVATSITISTTLRVIGPDPFVLLAIEDLRLGPDGVIDAASRQAEMVVGAGANSTDCTPSTAAEPKDDGGGGGGGGSFGSAGGPGGTGNTALGGAPAGISPTPGLLRGGCQAGNGGDGDLTLAIPSTGGKGGNGGGAVYLLAGGRMELRGLINASGAGGDQGLPGKSGAGGGGSGGMIAIDAKLELVATGARIFANGGGGGEGGDTGSDGNPGADPAMADAAAPGGDGGNGGAGSPGGAGAFLTTPADPGIGGGDGGGGGGGGVGFVLVLSGQPLSDAVVSPPQLP